MSEYRHIIMQALIWFFTPDTILKLSLALIAVIMTAIVIRQLVIKSARPKNNNIIIEHLLAEVQTLQIRIAILHDMIVENKKDCDATAANFHDLIG
jgi:hypothetical protein